MRLNTIGFAGKGLRQFIELLRDAQVSLLIDTRLRPSSQLSAYARREDIEFVLENYEHIRYVHAPELAPTDAILDSYRKTHDWSRYVEQFTALMAIRDMTGQLRGLIGEHDSVALLCSEARPTQCHRRLLAECYATEYPGVDLVHLETPAAVKEKRTSRAVAVR